MNTRTTKHEIDITCRNANRTRADRGLDTWLEVEFRNGKPHVDLYGPKPDGCSTCLKMVFCGTRRECVAFLDGATV